MNCDFEKEIEREQLHIKEDRVVLSTKAWSDEKKKSLNVFVSGKTS